MPAALTIRRALAATPGSISYSVEKRNRNFLALHTLYVNVWPPLHRAPPPFRFQTVTHQHMVNEGACGTASFIRFPLPSSVPPVTPSPPPPLPLHPSTGEHSPSRLSFVLRYRGLLIIVSLDSISRSVRPSKEHPSSSRHVVESKSILVLLTLAIAWNIF